MPGFFELLLGFEPAQWVGGKLSFGAPVHFAVAIGILAAVFGAVWILYRKTTIAAGRRLRTLLIALRLATLAILLVCLLQPMLITSRPVSQPTDIAVLMDNSRSMTIRDMDEGRSRRDVAVDLLYGENGLVNRLEDDFQLHTFGIGYGADPISGAGDLNFEAARTSLAEGLRQVRRTLKGLPLAAVVLISDGGDNSTPDPVREARILEALDIPVFTVGIGKSILPKDREITRVAVARTVMEESIFNVNVTVRSRGYAKQGFDIIIEKGGRVVASKTVLPGDSQATRRHTLELTAEDDGPQVYVVRIPEEADELIVQNNRRAFLVTESRRQADILYIEGHPRHEYKFIRRAAEGDKTLRLATFLKTGPHKFLRQGIESRQELATGFPDSKEMLFKYAAIVLGDIPGSFFSADQLAMIRQFVAERGGGFLMLGGSTAFEENFMTSPIADVLPVTLLGSAQIPPQLLEPAAEKFSLRLTAEGEHSALLRLGLDGAMNRGLWEKMPQLQGINVTGPAKPGATVLAVHPTLRLRQEPLPVIAYERYGRGRSMVIATASTWRWQMLLPHEDMSHERFWRQVLRWLAVPAPAPVELSLDRDSYGAGEPVQVRVQVRNRDYEPVNDATVWLKLTDSAGDIRDLRLEWVLDDAGTYTGSVNVSREGIYQLEVAATLPSGEVHEASTHFLAAEPVAEFIHADTDTDLLEKVASVSGGKFYTVNQAERLTNDLKHLQKVVPVDVETDIWDMPIVLMLLFGLLAVEWLIRRRKGMS
jgi:uncharacterized membrane protein